MAHFQCQAKNLDATVLLAEKIGTMGLKDAVVISPDKGAVAMAKTAAMHLAATMIICKRPGYRGTEVSMAPKEVAVEDRDVVIFDDMIATGGTMAEAVSLLRQQGARRVYLAAVHPVLAGSAMLKLYHAGVEAVLATDTLDKGSVARSR